MLPRAVHADISRGSYTIEHGTSVDGDVVHYDLGGDRASLMLHMQIDDAFFGQAAQSTRRVLMGYVAVACAVALAVSVLLTLRSVKPLRSLFVMLAGLDLPAQEERNSYAFIMHAIDSMRIAETHTREDYDRLRDYHTRHILRALLNGMRVAESDRSLLVQNIAVLRRPWRVLGVRLDWYEDETEGKKAVVLLSLQEQLRAAFEDALLLEEDPLLAVIADEDTILEHLDRIAREIQTAFGVYALFGVSLPMSSVAQLREAFEQATTASYAADAGRPRTILYTPEQRHALMPTVGTERLEQILTSGAEEALAEYFADAGQRLRPALSSVNARVVYYGVLAVVQRVCAQYAIEPPALHEYNYWMSIEDAMDYLRRTAAAQQRLLAEQRQRRYNEQAVVLVNYVHEQLGNSDLCLTMVADAMSMSDRKVSALILQQTGQRFADYVEGRRMEMAKSYLAEGSLPIGDIALLVGYAHSNTFYRAFRQSTGVSPSQYRSSRQGG